MKKVVLLFIMMISSVYGFAQQINVIGKRIIALDSIYVNGIWFKGSDVQHWNNDSSVVYVDSLYRTTDSLFYMKGDHIYGFAITPSLQQVTTVGNTTTDGITIGGKFTLNTKRPAIYDATGNSLVEDTATDLTIGYLTGGINGYGYNTYVGFEAGNATPTYETNNTIIGSQTAGNNRGSYNTVVGSANLLYGSALKSTIIGYNNFWQMPLSDTSYINNAIAIGDMNNANNTARYYDSTIVIGTWSDASHSSIAIGNLIGFSGLTSSQYNSIVLGNNSAATNNSVSVGYASGIYNNSLSLGNHNSSGLPAPGNEYYSNNNVFIGNYIRPSIYRDSTIYLGSSDYNVILGLKNYTSEANPDTTTTNDRLQVKGNVWVEDSLKLPSYKNDVAQDSVLTTDQSGNVKLKYLPIQLNSDWNATSGAAQILNKPNETNFNIYNQNEDSAVTVSNTTKTSIIKANSGSLLLSGNSPNTSFIGAVYGTCSFSNQTITIYFLIGNIVLSIPLQISTGSGTLPFSISYVINFGFNTFTITGILSAGNNAVPINLTGGTSNMITLNYNIQAVVSAGTLTINSSYLHRNVQ